MKFNPYGLHAIRIPLALLMYDGATQTRKSLSWGAKAFYGRLALFLGKPKAESFCNPDLRTMAAAMKTSEDTVGRWLVELAEHGFIERIRKGRGPAECVFLPHPCLLQGAAREDEPNSADVRNQESGSDSAALRTRDSDSNSADVPGRRDTPIPQPRGSNSATSPAQLRKSAVSIPQGCGAPILEENVQENVHQDVQENGINIINGGRNDDAAEFAAAVLCAVQARSCTAIRKLSSTDRELCRSWRAEGISLAIVERAVILGSARKTMTEINHHGTIAQPIRSLAYFRPLIGEVQGMEIGYFDHAERTLRRVEARLPDARIVNSSGPSATAGARLDGDEATSGATAAAIVSR